MTSATLSGVRHAGDVLSLFTRARAVWGVTEVSVELGVSKSHAHRLLATLTALGLLEHDGSSRYRLGLRWLAVSAVVLDDHPLILRAVHTMRGLKSRFNLDAELCWRDSGVVVCVQPFSYPTLVQRPLGACPAVERALQVESSDVDVERVAKDQQVLDRTEIGLQICDDRSGCAGWCVVAPVLAADFSTVAVLATHVPRDRWEVRGKDISAALRQSVRRLQA